MAIAKVDLRAGRVLDFDLENRPLSYLGSDFTTDEITAIAWSWVGSNLVEYLLLRADGSYEDKDGTAWQPEIALARFANLLGSADLVTGHYIRRHDLPMVNGALLEYGLFPLPPVLASDTKMDLVRRKGMSASQENLAAALKLDATKCHMSQVEWRKANRLTSDGMQSARERVVGDVVQHMALREALLKQGLLNAPKVWKP